MKTLAIACFATVAMVASAADTKPDAPRIFSDEVIRSWGYRTLKSERVEQGEWEAKHFGKATIRLQSIKGIDPLKDSKNTYYRFRIAEETFGSPDEAKKRIERIRDTPPGVDTKTEPHRVLCDGVAVGSVAYIVSTDSSKFHTEALPSLMKQVSAKVAGK